MVANTYEEAMNLANIAGRAAGNQSMKDANRDNWNEVDCEAALYVRNRIMFDAWAQIGGCLSDKGAPTGKETGASGWIWRRWAQDAR